MPELGAATERVGHGEALEAVAALGLLADDVKDGVDELGALGVVALGPVVARARLAEDEVVRAEDLAEGARADRVHGARLEVHEDVAGHVAAAGRLVVVHVDALELEVRVAVVGAGRVDAVLVGDDLQNLAPIWLPHWPPWIATISRMTNRVVYKLREGNGGRGGGDTLSAQSAPRTRCGPSGWLWLGGTKRAKNPLRSLGSVGWEVGGRKRARGGGARAWGVMRATVAEGTTSSAPAASARSPHYPTTAARQTTGGGARARAEGVGRARGGGNARKAGRAHVAGTCFAVGGCIARASPPNWARARRVGARAKGLLGRSAPFRG